VLKQFQPIVGGFANHLTFETRFGFISTLLSASSASEPRIHSIHILPVKPLRASPRTSRWGSLQGISLLVSLICSLLRWFFRFFDLRSLTFILPTRPAILRMPRLAALSVPYVAYGRPHRGPPLLPSRSSTHAASASVGRCRPLSLSHAAQAEPLVLHARSLSFLSHHIFFALRTGVRSGDLSPLSLSLPAPFVHLSLASSVACSLPPLLHSSLSLFSASFRSFKSFRS